VSLRGLLDYLALRSDFLLARDDIGTLDVEHGGRFSMYARKFVEGQIWRLFGYTGIKMMTPQDYQRGQKVAQSSFDMPPVTHVRGQINKLSTTIHTEFLAITQELRVTIQTLYVLAARSNSIA